MQLPFSKELAELDRARVYREGSLAEANLHRLLQHATAEKPCFLAKLAKAVRAALCRLRSRRPLVRRSS